MSDKQMNSTSETINMLLSNMDKVVGTKSVVGEPIKFGDTIIVPLVEMSLGLAAGGVDKGNDTRSSGAGVNANVAPTAVLVINEDGVQMIDIKNKDSVNKIVDMIPTILAKFTKKNDKGVDEVIDTISTEPVAETLQ